MSNDADQKTKVKALLSVHIFVDCPHCNKQHDLMIDIDYANDEGQMWYILKRSDDAAQAWNNIDMELDCPNCKKTFIFDSMEY